MVDSVWTGRLGLWCSYSEGWWKECRNEEVVGIDEAAEPDYHLQQVN